MNKRFAFLNKAFFALLLACPMALFGQADRKTLFFISNAHLDTQWNWDVRTTINEYVKNTMTQNFALLNKYPNFQFNYEGAIKYMWMKEYYPTEYSRLKNYISTGRWHVSGCSVDANDVMVSSAESIMRNWLYAKQFYEQEFGVRGGYDIMLPDCFGFSYALPSLARHCGFKGFHTAKLGWGAAGYDQLPPFGIWQGVDGSQIYAIYKPGAYDNHEVYNKDMSNDADMARITADNYSKYGVAAEVRYVGPRSDHGGGLQDNPSKDGENTPYWLDYSVASDGPVSVKMATPDEVFDYLDQYKNPKYKIKDGELPMRTHGVGAYTSRTMLKLWNRRNELLADATEKSASLAQWLGVQDYPQATINDAWVRNLWQAHHDGLPGTSIPNAYLFSMNDYVLANKTFANTFAATASAVIRQMDTQTEGMPVVVYNPLSFRRTDVVEARLAVAAQPDGIRVFDKDGNEVLSQITGYDKKTGTLSFIFAATVPSLGYTTYDVRFGQPSQLTSSLTVDEARRQLSNGIYRMTISNSGDISALTDLQNGKSLMRASQLQLIYDHEDTWPSWEISYTDVTRQATAVNDNVEVTLAEDGPLRKSFRVYREKEGSQFVQYVRMNALSNRIDCVTEADWQSRERMLKVYFPFSFSNPKATYDISLGTIERGNRSSDEYEVQGHQWADLSTESGEYGLSVLNDCKYGWDKPSNNTLRLTLIHTPSTGDSYTYQAEQDLGVNLFTYALFPHEGKWSEQTQMEASKLNQPLIAFTATKHDGALGKEVGFVSVNTDKVAVKAVKKAEQSDELIVRVYEWTGENQENVVLDFPAPIVSAREVSGLEDPVGDVTFRGKQLTFNIGKYQPKTFAVTLAASPLDESATPTADQPVELPYNVDVMSYDTRKTDAEIVAHAYPAELVPDVVQADGVSFTMGDRTNGAKNAVRCNGQTVSLPDGAAGKTLYLLMASTNLSGSIAELQVGSENYTFEVPYYGGTLGQLESPYNSGTRYRKQDVAFTATHSHSVSGNSNETYNFLYMYKYAVPLSDDATQLVLPSDNTLYLLSATVSDKRSDDVQPLTELNTYIDYRELGDAADDGRGVYFVPKTVVASQQISSSESAQMAADRNELTKWCVDGGKSKTPYLEYRFSEPVEICQWMVLNAGSEQSGYITRSFKLQRYENRRWVDVDVVEDNKDNKVVRGVTPFTTDRVRLQIQQGEQNGNTTRVYEFAVYGQPDETTGIPIMHNEECIMHNDPSCPSGSLYLMGNYPNPCIDKTTIRCRVPQGVDRLTLHVLAQDGRQVARQEYPVTAEGMQTLQWSPTLPSGVYLYLLTARQQGRTLRSEAKKLIINQPNY